MPIASIAMGERVERATVVTRLSPRYSPEAAEHRTEGPAILKCVITEDGSLTNCRVVKGLAYGMDQAVLEAVQQWKYTPVIFRGKPVRVEYTVVLHLRAPDLPPRGPDAGGR